MSMKDNGRVFSKQPCFVDFKVLFLMQFVCERNDFLNLIVAVLAQHEYGVTPSVESLREYVVFRQMTHIVALRAVAVPCLTHTLFAFVRSHESPPHRLRLSDNTVCNRYWRCRLCTECNYRHPL